MKKITSAARDYATTATTTTTTTTTTISNNHKTTTTTTNTNNDNDNNNDGNHTTNNNFTSQDFAFIPRIFRADSSSPQISAILAGNNLFSSNL